MSVNFLEAGAVATQDFSFWDGGINGTMAYDSTQTAMKFGPGYGETYRSGVLAPAGRRISFEYRTDTTPAALAAFGVLLSNTLNTFFSLKLTTSRTITATPQGATAVTGTTVLALNTWNRITIAFTYTNTTTFRFQVYVNGVAEVNCTAGTMTWTGTSVDGLDLQTDTNAGASVQSWFRNIYVDDVSDYSDTGSVLVKAARPNANGTTNGFTTQVGSTGSGYGTGHSPQVNERPLSVTNGWAMIGAGSAITEEYNVEGVTVGDADLTNATIMGVRGWAYAKALASETGSIIVDGTLSNIALTSTATMFTQNSATPTLHPTGSGVDIGIKTTTALTTVTLYECGIHIAYIPHASNFLMMMFP